MRMRRLALAALASLAACGDGAPAAIDAAEATPDADAAAIDATVDVTLARPRDEADYRAALTEVRAQANRLAQLTSQLFQPSRLVVIELQ